jgi:hypothetical protein
MAGGDFTFASISARRHCNLKLEDERVTRWNGKPDLTAIQLQEKKRRRMLDRRMRFGMSQPKGTKPREYPIGEPVLKPMPRPGFSFDDFLGTILGFISLGPWFGQRRRRREADLAQEQRSQSIKARGVN